MDKPYLKVSEFAEIFHLDIETVWRQIRRGRTRAVNVGTNRGTSTA